MKKVYIHGEKTILDPTRKLKGCILGQNLSSIQLCENRFSCWQKTTTDMGKNLYCAGNSSKNTTHI